MVICNVAKILELVVPLMEHPSETFLATIEEDLMKLIIKYGMTVSIHFTISLLIDHLWCLSPYFSIACIKIYLSQVTAFSIKPFKELLVL